jgi:hypothetical protein
MLLINQPAPDTSARMTVENRMCEILMADNTADTLIAAMSSLQKIGIFSADTINALIVRSEENHPLVRNIAIATLGYVRA